LNFNKQEAQFGDDTLPISVENTPKKALNLSSNKKNIEKNCLEKTLEKVPTIIFDDILKLKSKLIKDF
jgi:hypothetical protein